jgi:hypothetical protein
VRYWYVTARRTAVGRLVELVGSLFVLAREGAPSEVDELEPHSEMELLLVLESPTEMRGKPGGRVGAGANLATSAGKLGGGGVGVGAGGSVGFVLITVAKMLAS